MQFHYDDTTPRRRVAHVGDDAAKPDSAALLDLIAAAYVSHADFIQDGRYSDVLWQSYYDELRDELRDGLDNLDILDIPWASFDQLPESTREEGAAAMAQVMAWWGGLTKAAYYQGDGIWLRLPSVLAPFEKPRLEALAINQASRRSTRRRLRKRGKRDNWHPTR